MTYDPNLERMRLYEYISQWNNENHQHTRQEQLQRANSIALDELNEIGKKCQELMESLEHLVLFREVMKSSFNSVMLETLALYSIFRTNYSKEQIDQMPMDQYQKVMKEQQMRVDLLNKIAQVYFKGGNQK